MTGKQEKLVKHIRRINQLTEEDQQYLYGKCDEWCLDNFREGLEIVAEVLCDKGKPRMIHSYLRDPEGGRCYDIRGGFDDDEDILLYTGIDCHSDYVTEFVFDQASNFDTFLIWIEAEAWIED